MKKSNNFGFFTEKIKQIRRENINKKKPLNSKKLNEPVSFWIKDDRLLNKKGKEFTIILRTKGCSWALGDNGGCSMCGYINDSTLKPIENSSLINQIKFAFQNKLQDIEKENKEFILKIFNSGSFLDETEISKEVRNFIYQEVNKYDKIKEFIIESRLDYVSKRKLMELKHELKNKYIELAIGLETVNDHIRNTYINKGLNYKTFLKVVNMCKELGIGIRAYLLFKPPFLSEQGAIDDCIYSIQTLIDLEIETISINPVNIQNGTFVEHLWYQNRYRPPWFYSLFKTLRKIYELNGESNLPRLISDPSGAGTKRGIHNCLKRECNDNMLNILRNSVLTQNFKSLSNLDFECDCLIKYRLQKKYN